MRRKLSLVALIAAPCMALSLASVSQNAGAYPSTIGTLQKARVNISTPAPEDHLTYGNRPTLTLEGKVTRPAQLKAIVLSIRHESGRYARSNGLLTAARTTIHRRPQSRWSVRISLPPGEYKLTVRSVARNKNVKMRTLTRSFKVESRDVLLWPYPRESFWNMPRGEQAKLIDFSMEPPQDKTLKIEDDLLFLTPTLAKNKWASIGIHDAGWRGDRCGASDFTKSLKLGGDFLFPLTPLFGGEKYGLFPNHSTAIVMPDYSLRETQPLALCSQGYSSQFASPKWQNDSLKTGGMGPNENNTSGGGSHGGSFMTAFGGTIRLNEWVKNGNIPHATKIELWSKKWLTNNAQLFQGYRWPALAADNGWANFYETLAPSPRSPHAVMGALLTLPNSFQLSTLQTEPARILARSFKKYGTYVVDDTGRDTVQIATEWSHRGRVTDQFRNQWGYSMDGDYKTEANPAKKEFLQDMNMIYSNLMIVSDNSRTIVGGAGKRLAPLAPPLQ